MGLPDYQNSESWITEPAKFDFQDSCRMWTSDKERKTFSGNPLCDTLAPREPLRRSRSHVHSPGPSKWNRTCELLLFSQSPGQEDAKRTEEKHLCVVRPTLGFASQSPRKKRWFWKVVFTGGLEVSRNIKITWAWVGKVFIFFNFLEFYTHAQWNMIISILFASLLCPS